MIKRPFFSTNRISLTHFYSSAISMRGTSIHRYPSQKSRCHPGLWLSSRNLAPVHPLPSVPMPPLGLGHSLHPAWTTTIALFPDCLPHSPSPKSVSMKQPECYFMGEKINQSDYTLGYTPLMVLYCPTELSRLKLCSASLPTTQPLCHTPAIKKKPCGSSCRVLSLLQSCAFCSFPLGHFPFLPATLSAFHPTNSTPSWRFPLACYSLLQDLTYPQAQMGAMLGAPRASGFRPHILCDTHLITWLPL